MVPTVATEPAERGASCAPTFTAHQEALFAQQQRDWPKALAGGRQGNPFATLCDHCCGRHAPPNADLCPHLDVRGKHARLAMVGYEHPQQNHPTDARKASGRDE